MVNPCPHSKYPYKTLLYLPKYYHHQPDLAAIIHATTAVFQSYPILNTAPYKEALNMQLRVLKLEDKSKLLETTIAAQSSELATVGKHRRIVASALRKILDPYVSTPLPTHTTDDPQNVFVDWFNSTYTFPNSPEHTPHITVASLLTEFKLTDRFVALPSTLQKNVNRKTLVLWLTNAHDCVDNAGKHVVGGRRVTP